MKLFNTLTNTLEAYAPQDGKTVGMYVCGPTVYDNVHIGNLRPILVFDTMRRYFEQFKKWDVVHVQNVTDVDDKLINRSIETGESVEEIAEIYTKAFFDLVEGLGVLEPTHSPKATEHITEMIELIRELETAGYAYAQDGDVYFRVEAVSDYGKLSGHRPEDQEAGARIAASEKKENPLDFTLWKAAKPGEPKWPSPWGEGRPGWHTECVVMSRKYLGDRRDIHAGGFDLAFPHHENEIAQAEATTEGPFFRFWLHNGLLSFEGEKMSKSLGNFAYAKDVLEQFDPETVRYFYLSRHYRKPLAYSVEGLEAARTAVVRANNVLSELDAELEDISSASWGAEGDALVQAVEDFRSRYIQAMDDDLNTSGALGAIHELLSAIGRFRQSAPADERGALKVAVQAVRELGKPLGLFQPREAARVTGIEPDLIGLLIELRASLRTKKEFELTDRIRDRLGELGVVLKDTPEGTTWSS